MALKNNGDIMTEFLVRNSITTTDGYITDSTLQGWLKDAAIYCSSYKKWPFTEGRVSTTYASTEEWSFEGYKVDSFRMMLIGGKRLTKLNFEDYMTFREEEPQANDRVYSDFGRVVFINPNVGITGSLVAYGQYMPVLDVTDFTAQPVFSDWDDEGNEAIVVKMTEYFKNKLHLTQEAQYFSSKTDETLEKVYRRVLDEKYKEQTHPSSGGMFKGFDVLQGQQHDGINNPNRWSL